MTLDTAPGADDLRALRSLSQAEVDRRGSVHDLDDYSARERAPFESQALAIVKIT